MNRLLSVLIFLGSSALSAADVLDDAFAFQSASEAVFLEQLSGRTLDPEISQTLEKSREALGHHIKSAEAGALWSASGSDGGPARLSTFQHVAALEMLAALDAGDIELAREWRALIALPKFANAIDGTMALQQLGAKSSQRKEVGKLLAREYFLWQITRAREKTDDLSRLIASGRQTPELLAARVADIEALSTFPKVLYQRLDLTESVPPAAAPPNFGKPSEVAAWLPVWKARWAETYPDLLTPEDVASRERILLKLLRLVPIEYQSGVRDGEIVIPIEYREALTFSVQARRMIAELLPVWRRTRAQEVTEHSGQLLQALDQLEEIILAKRPLSEIQNQCISLTDQLGEHFGLSLKRQGTGGDAVTEASLEVRSLLGESLAAALAGKWRQAEALRLEAYVNFDLDIEMRVLPREPNLAIRAEKTFLDGAQGQPGIKSALDARLEGPELEAAYQRAFRAMEECVALCKVGLAPGAAALSATLIVLREGLEAVVILAALLAGLRGPENAAIRRRIGLGAWLALAASAALFAISRTLLSGLSRHGELLEAIISLIAVAILLMVTNWVFHKFYWTGWNARLRQLGKSAVRPKAPWLESLALVGVGFMTIFREGFETTLFMQSLILEAGMGPALAGLAMGGVLIGILGFAVFFFGARLPYRKMLVLTGVLVIFVLFTFVGSTVRILQTIGWLPIHPVPGLSMPTWTGVWLGLYPTWEGLLIPFLVFVYVGGAWLWVKISVSGKSQPASTPKVPTQNADPLGARQSES